MAVCYLRLERFGISCMRWENGLIGSLGRVGGRELGEERAEGFGTFLQNNNRDEIRDSRFLIILVENDESD